MNKALVILFCVFIGYCVAIDPVCQLPIEIGICRAAKPRYAYNMVKGDCEKFFYGGCMGNTNNFATIEECRKTCH
ncbi:hypothetical protein evm_013844 [Chilo suppressalis]|nr:hypothetical protein evm_013844 [Chilo suppressalis]